MKQLYTTLLFLCSICLLHAQVVTIKGSVQLKDQPNGFYAISIYKIVKKDTLLQATCPFSSTAFSLPVEVPPETRLKLTVSSLGYTPLSFYWDISENTTWNIGQQTLEVDPVMLKQITVKGKHPLIKNDGWKTIVDVKNSFLNNTGTFKDMLKKVPGLISHGDIIEVPGRGIPLILVDGRPLNTLELMELYTSGIVDNIEIDRNPSSRYSANAVINIKTKSGLPDHLLLSVNTIFKVNKKLSSMPSLLFNMKWGKFTTRLSYAYNDQYYKYNDTYYRYIYHKDYTYSRFSLSDILENNRTHRVQWGTDFTLDKNNVFSFLYSYSFVRDRNDRTNQITTQDSLKTESYETEGNSRSRRNQHSFSLSYDHTFKDNSKLWITTDYATIRSTNDYHSYEYYPTSDYRRATNSTSHSSYNIYTTSLDYAFKLPGSIETETGFKYSNTHTPSNSSTDNPSAIALGYTDRTVMDDRILAGYLNLSKKWKKLNVDVGGRYEFAQTRVRAWTENKEKQVNRYFSNFLPNIKALYRFNESWAVYTSYKQTINRPTFYDLDPSVVYRDSMTYSGGNTRAVPSLRHDYTIGAQWKNIYLEIGLTNTKNFSDRANICINEHSNAVVNVPFILPSIYFYKVRLNGYKNFKKWYLYGAATCFIPHARFSDPQIVWRPKIATVKLTGNIIYQFTDHLGVSVFLEYQGENEQFLYKQEGALRSYFTLDGTFLKKKLNVSLFVWDPFNLANYNKIYTHYMNVRDGSTGYSKSRCIGISITYKFLNKELNVKAKQKNEKELERTEKR